jgi:hypothetical protein
VVGRCRRSKKKKKTQKNRCDGKSADIKHMWR